MNPDWDALRADAAAATTNSHSPFSGFPVGAAGQTGDGRVFTATNVESASFVAGICAETALVGVLAANGVGRGELRAIAVTDPSGNPLSPCGRCRQLLSEYGGDDLTVNERPMRELLPDAFGPEDLP